MEKRGGGVWADGRFLCPCSGATVSDQVRVAGLAETDLVVVIDGSALPRSQWEQFVPAEDAIVHILTLLDGG